MLSTCFSSRRDARHSDGVQPQCLRNVVLKCCGEAKSGSNAILVRLAFIPESWTDDRARCRRVHIQDDVESAPKWTLAPATRLQLHDLEEKERRAP
jgi:hypothetical protein